MNARAATVFLVLFALSIAFAPSAEAGTCVISGDQCFDATKTTAGGGRTFVSPADDQYIATANDQDTCKEFGGVWDPAISLDAVPLCQNACCCDLRAGAPPQVKAPANACPVGTQYKAIADGVTDPTCATTCTSAPTPIAQCLEGRIIAANCQCGNIPVSQGDVDQGHFCCWNGQIATNANSCPAKPSNYCKLNEPLNTKCQCGTVEISTGVCCTGSIPKASLDLCPVVQQPPPGTALCGNLKKEGSEMCDATYQNQNGVWTKKEGDGCANPNQICTSTCSCQAIKNPVCGDNVCDSVEATGTAQNNPLYCPTDCPSSATCQPIGGQYPAPLEFKAAWNSQTEEVDLTWKHPSTCTDNRGGYRLQRSYVSAAEAVTKPSAVQYLGKDILTATDDTPPEATIIYYILYATYDGTNTGKAEVMLAIPNELCPGKDVSYCVSATEAVNCVDYKPIVTDCADPEIPARICSLSTGQATCELASNQCELCNGVFGMFPDGSRRIKVGNLEVACSNPASTCYKDLGSASTELYKSCTMVQSCGSYRTETACEGNVCDVADDTGCQWNVYDGIGYCRASNEEMRNCEDCTIENGCIADVCKEIGGDECYFYDPEEEVPTRDDIPPGCYDPTDLVCEMYTNEEDCLGGTDFSLNTQQSNNRRVSGDNTYKTKSADAAGLGKCLWIEAGEGGSCVRDADDNSRQDLGNNADLPLLQDFTNPTSGVLGNPNAIYPKTFVVQYASESTESYQCIARPNDACYPIADLRSGAQIRREFLNVADNGLWALRHYSVDLSKNLEFVQQFLFQIDMQGPQMTVKITQTTYPFNNAGSRTNAEVRIDVTERATCTTQLLTQQGASIPGIKELQQILGKPEGVFGQNFVYSYPELTDGQYALRVTCTDTSQNTNNIVHNFAIDTNPDITNPRPIGRTPPLNQTSVTIQIDTIRDAICRYGQRGMNWAQMTPYGAAAARTHNATVNVGTGEYRYQTACDFAGVIVYGGTSDDIIFSVDKMAPTVMLCEQRTTDANVEQCLTTPFLNNRSQTHRIALRCADRPGTSPSFGCERTAIFSCIENATGPACTPTAGDMREATFDKIPKQLRYYAIDRGGAKGSEQTLLLNLTDTTPPELEFRLE